MPWPETPLKAILQLYSAPDPYHLGSAGCLPAGASQGRAVTVLLIMLQALPAQLLL